jgi:8-amino-7-oxononanoate synthase
MNRENGDKNGKPVRTAMDFAGEIERLKSEFLYRERRVAESLDDGRVRLKGRSLVNLGSNNYLGLSEDPRVREAFIEGIRRWGCGAGASRLVTGTLAVHRDLEQALARFSRKEAALVFPAGYMANLGLISTLASSGDWVILDKTDHASIIDGARLSGARIRVFPHRDLDALERLLRKCPAGIRRFVVTDTVFSMDGDLADLRGIAELKHRYGFTLIVDEAHAVGIFGDTGSGLAEEQGVCSRIDFKVGTLSKAIGLQGGYVAASRDAVDYLRNRCRSFVYTTGIAPGICSAALSALESIRADPGAGFRLRERAHRFRAALGEYGWSTRDSNSQIVPVDVNDPRRGLEIEKGLRRAGFLVPFIRYPTVKKGTERLRISLTARIEPERLDALEQWFRDNRFT